MDLKVYGIVFSKNMTVDISLTGTVKKGETFLSAMERLGEELTAEKLDWKRCATVFGKKGKRGTPAYELAVFYAVTEADTKKVPLVIHEFGTVFQALAAHQICGGSPADTTIQLL